MKYKKIYVAADNSKLSHAAMKLAVQIGRHDGSELFGSHVYAARLHDQRFRMMESGLPEPYQVETELEKQRDIHDSLITRGLELITDSYLKVMKSLCEENEVSFTGLSLEGKNWQELVKDINAHGYDLVALGAHGIGKVSDSLLGTVTERVLRRVKTDVLICKNEAAQNKSDRVVVCLDGSPRSWGALMRGIDLARAFQKKLTAVSVFDPHFHHVMFGSLNGVLTDKARKVFKFEEQEKLHEEIIDSGLAKIYQAHLDIATRVAEDENFKVETHLLDGKAFQKILEFVRKDPPWLLIVGRVGIHSDEEMDIGGNTENLCRLADCNILVTETMFKPSLQYQAEATVTWTKEAESTMGAVPEMFRAIARKAVENYCLDEGHTVITSSILSAAVRKLLPAEMIERMGITFESDEEHRLQDGPLESCDRVKASEKMVWTDEAVHRLERVPEGFMRNAAQESVEGYAKENGIRHISLEVAEKGLVTAREQMASAMQEGIGGGPGRAEAGAPQCPFFQETERGSFECTKCSYVVDGKRPHTCQSCGIAGVFRPLSELERKAVPQTALSLLQWDERALARVERIPAGFMRTMTKCRVEQWARKHSQSRVTVQVVEAKYDSWKEGSSSLQQELIITGWGDLGSFHRSIS
jgi:nucleotide-binding universal stress UspA family protein